MAIQNIQNIGMGIQRTSYANNTAALRKSTQKLSTGRRINKAGDDAAGLAVSIELSSQASNYSVAAQNARSGMNMLRTTDAAMTEMHGMLDRMYSLSVQSSSALYGNEERFAMQSEMDSLKQEITRIAESTNYNGRNLLNGGAEALRLNVGDSEGQDLPSVDATASGLGLDALRLDSQDGAEDSVETIRSAINTISGMRGTYGAMENRLDHTISRLNTAEDNTAEGASLIRDTDMAQTAMQRTRESILRQVNYSMMAQANQNSYGVLRLIQG